MGRTAGVLSLVAIGLVVTQIVLAAPPSADFTISPGSPNVNQTVTFTSSSTDPDNDIQTYEWDFNYDGSFNASASGTSASTSYSTGGSKTVALRVTDAAGDPAAGGDGTVDSDLSVKSFNVVVPNQDPVATDIAFNNQPPNNGNIPHVGETVVMAGSGSDPDGDPVTYEWNFGDGGTATGQSVSHAYSSRGSKTVTLTVRDNRGGTGARQESITINALPVADAHVLNSSAEPGQRIDTPLVGQPYALTSGQVPGVSGSGSSDQEGSLTFAWDLNNDGTFETSGANVPSTAALRTAGMKTVALRATDSNQATSEESLTFRVNNAPIPGFSWEPATPAVAKPVQFSSTSSDPDGNAVDPLTYSWDLDGDGTFGESSPNEQGQNPPAVSFASAGSKTVRLRVTDTGGITREVTRSVLVQLSVPNGAFTVSPSSPLPGQPVTFTSTSTPSEPGKQITKVEWDFDYGGPGTFNVDATSPSPGAPVSYAFPSAGAKTVAIRATEGPSGGFDEEAATVVVNAPPRASFSVSPASPFTGEPATISSSSADPDGPLAAQQWDLDGDGAFDDAAGPVVFATFITPGSKRIRLRVTDSRGAAATAEGSVDVQTRPVPPAPRASMIQGVVVTMNGSVGKKRTRIRRLLVRAPSGSRVVVTCKGKSCAKRASKRGTGRSLRFKAYERALRPKTKIVISVTQAGFIGRQTTFTIRRGRGPKRVDLCLAPGATKATSCTTS